MKVSGRNDAAVVEFTGKVQRIAWVHQFGLRDRLSPHSHYVQYTKRQLLGFAKVDKKIINDLLLKHVS
ncbi:hypothetical protein CCAJJPOJ_01416 [Lelliottia sp. T2.26D-8]|nr:hypothetical protein CCAJJPOJ_01416 [Lelliottia sp. T2.26D-8]